MFVIEASERPIPHPQVRTLLWKSTASALNQKLKPKKTDKSAPAPAAAPAPVKKEHIVTAK